jgi:hypothetical protein
MESYDGHVVTGAKRVSQSPVQINFPLRVVLVSNVGLQAWQVKCVQSLLATGDVELVLRLVRRRGGERTQPFIWRMYERAYVSRRSRARQIAALPDVLSGVRLVEAEGDDLAVEIRRAEADIVLQFAGGPPSAEVRSAARLGVWGFDFDLLESAPGFRELDEGAHCIKGALVDWTENDCVEIDAGWFKTNLHSISRTLDSLFFGCADLPARAVQGLRQGSELRGLIRSPAARDREESSWRAACLLLKLVRRFAPAGIQFAFGVHEWAIGVVDAPASSFLGSGPRPPVRWLTEPSRGGFLADPFAVRRDGELIVLAEQYSFRRTRGVIAALRISDSGRPAIRTVMEGPFHMAYPYVIEEDGEIFCTPSTPAERRVVLYQATDFPNRWQGIATLIEDFAATDPTIFRHGDLWWLFCTDGDMGSATKLHAWYAPALLGPWTPHALNPLKTDVRSARPAGRPFIHQGTLYRPGQDGSRTYGGAVVLNRVSILSPTEFEETPAAYVPPYEGGPYPDGLHTFCPVGDVVVIDSKREILTVWTLWRRAKYVARRLTGRLPRHSSYS